MTKSTLKALCIVGSPRQESKTRLIVNRIDAELTKHGIQSEIWHLAERPLPIMDTEQRADPSLITDENVLSFFEKVRAADIMVWATPTYHGSISGALKNALDWLPSTFFREKTVGLICHSGGTRKMQPLVQLRVLGRAVGSYVIRGEVATCDEDFLITEDNKAILESDDIKTRLDQFCQELVEFTTVIKIGKHYVDNAT